MSHTFSVSGLTRAVMVTLLPHSGGITILVGKSQIVNRCALL